MDNCKTKPLFEIVTTSHGAVSIRNNRVNEIMHNPVGPWQEANELYIEQSQLKGHIDRALDTELIIFDVGLGAAANALAALHCIYGKKRQVRLVSFEIELELLYFALKHSSQFAHFSGFEKPIKTLLENGFWESKNVKWELKAGDFLTSIESVEHKAHIIYYDPYSPQVNQEMWSTECFKKLRKRCQESARLYNYSQATPIRVALLEADFYVGYGIATGDKKTTTEAAYRLKDIKSPLDARWLQRWKRSYNPFPWGCEDKKALLESIINHNQFGGEVFYRC